MRLGNYKDSHLWCAINTGQGMNLYSSCFIILRRRSIPQSDINIHLRNTFRWRRYSSHKVYSNIPIFMQIFTLIPSTVASLYPFNLTVAPVRTWPTDFGITVHYSSMSKSPRKLSSLPSGHLPTYVHMAFGYSAGCWAWLKTKINLESILIVNVWTREKGKALP